MNKIKINGDVLNLFKMKKRKLNHIQKKSCKIIITQFKIKN